MVSAFSHLTNATCELTVLSPQDVFVLQMDASLFGLGAVLSVIQNGKDMLVAFTLARPEELSVTTLLWN